MNIPREFSHPVQIGRGSFSKVYRAYQQKLERHVVLKIIPLPRAEEADRTVQEAHVLASMRLPCVPHIYDVVRFRKKVIIVMEWVRGIPLAALMDRPMAADCSAAIASAIICNLALLHNNTIVHCDLKPENIIVAPDAKIVFVDFGFSFLQHAGHAGRSASGVMQGTPAYMAPELWSCRDAIDYKKADLFALGVVLQNLLGASLPAFAAQLTESDPAARPQDCASFEKTWRGLRPPAANAGALAAFIGPAVEEYIARLLLAGARQLHGDGRKEEAYSLVTESLEAWPDNPEAIDFLQNRFSLPIRAPGKKNRALGVAAAAAFIAALIAAYVLGMRSSSPRDSAGGRAALRDPDERHVSLLTAPRAARQVKSPPIALRGIAAGMDVTGTVTIIIPDRAGSLVIDGTTVAHRRGERGAVSLPAGTHRIEWFDSTMQRRYGETIELLPFESKTISFARFIHGT